MGKEHCYKQKKNLKIPLTPMQYSKKSLNSLSTQSDFITIFEGIRNENFKPK